jgi:hypothetical protein
MGGGVVLSVNDPAPQRVASIVMLSAIGVQKHELTGGYGLNHFLHGAQLTLCGCSGMAFRTSAFSNGCRLQFNTREISAPAPTALYLGTVSRPDVDHPRHTGQKRSHRSGTRAPRTSASERDCGAKRQPLHAVHAPNGSLSPVFDPLTGDKIACATATRPAGPIPSLLADTARTARRTAGS